MAYQGPSKIILGDSQVESQHHEPRIKQESQTTYSDQESIATLQETINIDFTSNVFDSTSIVEDIVPSVLHDAEQLISFLCTSWRQPHYFFFSSYELHFEC